MMMSRSRSLLFIDQLEASGLVGAENILAQHVKPDRRRMLGVHHKRGLGEHFLVFNQRTWRPRDDR